MMSLAGKLRRFV